MRTTLVATAVTAAVVTALSPVAVQANHSWEGFHWARQSNPFTLKLGDNVTAKWNSHLATTSSDWTASEVLDTTIVAGSARRRTCKPTLGRVEVCNASYGATGWLGVASVWISGTHITQGNVKLNNTYFDTARYNTPAWRNLVSCQEVGHTLGLDHQDETFENPNLGTCMDYTDNPSSNQHPNQHDYDQLETIYGHLDSSTTVGAAAPEGSQARVGNAEQSWGRRVEGSRAAGQATYLRRLGGDQLVVTFVTWA